MISLGIVNVENDNDVQQLQKSISDKYGIVPDDFYLICNGKKVQQASDIGNINTYVVLRMLGGKGGFGSMLRALGAQIEKTTNREACRDLSGRRLRDINEEERLRTWLENMDERERESQERKKERLEKLTREPKTEFKDEEYETQRKLLRENISEAMEHGLKNVNKKRKLEEKKSAEKSKKPKGSMWLDEFEDIDTDSSSSECEEEIKPPAPVESIEDKPCCSKNI